jgi:hypothetical protein
MANDNFYGYSNKKPEFILPNGNIDMAFEKINPYEFKRGMDYELTKMGCRNLQSSTPEQREKATTIVLKNLNEMGGYYSGLISYETEYRGRKDKPSFKKYMEGMAEHGMKEINKEFKKDKMENIKLRESINKLVKEVLEEVMSSMGSTEGAGKTFKNVFRAIGDFIAKYLVPILENTLMPLISAVGNAFKAIIYIIGAVIKVFQSIYHFIRGVFSLITGDVDGAKEHFGKSFSAIAKAFEFAFKAIKEIFIGVFNVLRASFAPILPVFKVIFNAILAVVKFVFNVIWAVVKQVFDWIVSYIKFVLSFWKEVFTTIGMVFSEIWNGIKIAFDFVWGLITEAISLGVSIWTGIFETIGMVFSEVWNGIKIAFDIVWGLITGAISLGVAIWTGIFETIKIIFSEVWDGIKIAFDIVWGGITSAIDGIRSVVLGVKDAIVGAFKTAFNLIADIWNNTVGKLRFRIPSWVPPPLGGKGFDVPQIEKFTGGGGGGRGDTVRTAAMYRARLAKGGTVLPTPGGTLAVIGEAGRPERVEPLDPDGLSKRDKAMITLLSGGKGGGITMNVYPSPGMNETELASKISRELAFQLRRGAA